MSQPEIRDFIPSPEVLEAVRLEQFRKLFVAQHQAQQALFASQHQAQCALFETQLEQLKKIAHDVYALSGAVT